ncbi:MAG TPA: FAD-dependent oxidoreductase [Vicinamibacterales bacterium]|nr:FAD-dependent oxidoreductase [Vicinamibacterales bacterium]
MSRATTRYAVSPWLHRSSRSRRPDYPRHRGPLEIDVAIVGGGLTGCATAYAFAAAGIHVALFEAARVGQGATAYGGGLITSDPGVDFLALEAQYGRRAARHVWQAWRHAALDAMATLRRLAIPCHLQPRDAIRLAARDEDKTLRREWQARRDAGLEASLLKGAALARETGSDGLGLRTRDHGQMDPYRACVGLARAAAARGASLFERSAVRRITFDRRRASLQTEGGTVTAGRVVIATGLPTPLFRPLQRHFAAIDTYLVLTEPVPAAVRKTAVRPGLILRDGATPPHHLHWEDEDRRLLISGADQPAVPASQQSRVLVQRTGQLMYELSTLYPAVSGLQAEYGWRVTYGRAADGLPCVGPHRNYPHHLFALGQAGQSLAGSFLAGRLLLREYLGDPHRADELFAFSRLPR